MKKYRTPHTVACMALREFSRQTGVSLKQSEILITIFEAKYISPEDLADLSDIKISTLNNHLQVLYKKRWLKMHPKELFMISLSPDIREHYAMTMSKIHRDARIKVNDIVAPSNS